MAHGYDWTLFSVNARLNLHPLQAAERSHASLNDAGYKLAFYRDTLKDASATITFFELVSAICVICS